MPTSPGARVALTLVQIVALVLYLFAPVSAFAADPTDSPTPDATATALPEATASPDATPTEAPTPIETATQAPTPTEPAARASEAATPSTEPTVQPSGPTAEPAGVPYLVTFNWGISPADQAAVLESVGAADLSTITQLRMHAVTLPASSEADAVAALWANSAVSSVTADRVRQAEASPSDASYAEQWSLPKIGWDSVYGSPIAGSAKVALLDTGVDGTHPDLDANLVPGFSVLDGSTGLTDANGHGTWMAGIVAAETDNGAGIAGVAYAGVSIMPVTVLAADGTGQDSDIISGVVYAADHGADVILMAFSNPGFSPALQAAIDYAWAKGAVLVAATGNDGSSSATYPAGDRSVVGVASTDADDALAASSNRGPAAFLAAPGEGIVTTSADGGVTSVSGTSAAAAEVAG
ncbi:MAG TPA: S8 family serine peptidase, partial [Candidatus Limnocylindria bacterium]|nr:S8 family serine peptidase [Candidatus Limnocylindria bacterium]